MVLLAPVPQDPAYHGFADARGWFGIANFADVASNIAILLPALWGLALASHATGRDAVFRTVGERRLAVLFFAALLLTAVGSAWYHIAPDNARLFWDRLPLSLAFTTLPALLLAERSAVTRSGRPMLILWLLVGPASVLYWQLGELTGQGDLRPYFLLHGFMFLLPPVLIAAPTPYTRHRLYLAAYTGFVVAMACDRLDQPIFDLTAGLVSGHTLKHLLMGLAIALLAHMFAVRRVKGAYREMRAGPVHS